MRFAVSFRCRTRLPTGAPGRREAGESGSPPAAQHCGAYFHRPVEE